MGTREDIDELREVMMACVDADRKISRLLQQMNDRLATIERTVNTFIYGEGFEARAPSTYFVRNEGAAVDEESEISDEDVQKLLKRSQTVNQSTEVKSQVNSDGTQIYRYRMPGNRWAVIKLTRTGDFVEPPFIEDINGTRDELDHETATEMLARQSIYIPNRPMGSDPDPRAMDRVMNPEVE